MWMSAVLVPWFGVGWSKETQGYNPELPILQGPALHILIKHVCHVIKLAPGDGDSCGREQLLAGAAMTGRVRGSLEQLVTITDPGGTKWAGGSCLCGAHVRTGHRLSLQAPASHVGSPHMMVALSSSISSRSRRASSCIWLRSCCSLVMYSTVFCSVMAWLVCRRVWGQSSAHAPGPSSPPNAPRQLTSLELLEIKLFRVSKPILMLKRLFCSAEMCFICRFCWGTDPSL